MRDQAAMPSAWRHLVAGLAFFLSSACGPVEVESGVPDGTEGRQWSDVWGTQDSTTVWLVVVDDAPTEQARELRDRLGEWLYPGDDECGGPNDPAHVESRTDLTVLIGAAEPDRAQTTLGHPEWALEHPRSGDGAYERASQAVVEAAAELETESTEPLRALDALESWRALLDGERAPRTDEEQRFVLQLPASYLVHALVLATRDDESEIARIGQTPARYSYWSFEAWLQVPECADVHGSRPQALPHLADGANWSGYSCQPTSLAAKCGLNCGPQPEQLDDGRVACRAWLELPAERTCQPARGWLDPEDEQGERRPRVVEVDGEPRRLCEIAQLEGDALASCRTDPECSNCAPGWCLREPWTDEQVEATASEIEQGAQLHHEYCPSSADPIPRGRFRFTGGSNVAALGQARLVCDL